MKTNSVSLSTCKSQSSFSMSHQLFCLRRLVQLADSDFGCDNCGEQSQPSFSCKCKAVSYCSEFCRRIHWSCHRKLCTTFSAQREDHSLSVSADSAEKRPGSLNARRHLNGKKAPKQLSSEPPRDPDVAEQNARALIEEEEREKRSVKRKNSKKSKVQTDSRYKATKASRVGTSSCSVLQLDEAGSASTLCEDSAILETPATMSSDSLLSTSAGAVHISLDGPAAEQARIPNDGVAARCADPDEPDAPTACADAQPAGCRNSRSGAASSFVPPDGTGRRAVPHPPKPEASLADTAPTRLTAPIPPDATSTGLGDAAEQADAPVSDSRCKGTKASRVGTSSCTVLPLDAAGSALCEVSAAVLETPATMSSESLLSTSAGAAAHISLDGPAAEQARIPNDGVAARCADPDEPDAPTACADAQPAGCRNSRSGAASSFVPPDGTGRRAVPHPPKPEASLADTAPTRLTAPIPPDATSTGLGDAAEQADAPASADGGAAPYLCANVAQAKLRTTFACLQTALCLDPSARRARDAIIAQVKARLEQFLAERGEACAAVILFGSAACGLDLPSSDVDFALCMDWVHSAPLRAVRPYVLRLLCDLADALRRDGLDPHLVSARVPVVRFRWAGLPCDVSVQDAMTCNDKADLLRAAAAADSRFPALLRVLLHLARERGINSAVAGTLNSFTYALLTLDFLRTRPPPPAPVQTAAGAVGAGDRGDAGAMAAGLVEPLLCYVQWRLEEGLRLADPGVRGAGLFVRDPLDPADNAARALTPDGARRAAAELCRARRILAETGDLGAACEAATPAAAADPAKPPTPPMVVGPAEATDAATAAATAAATVVARRGVRRALDFPSVAAASGGDGGDTAWPARVGGWPHSAKENVGETGKAGSGGGVDGNDTSEDGAIKDRCGGVGGGGGGGCRSGSSLSLSPPRGAYLSPPTPLGCSASPLPPAGAASWSPLRGVWSPPSGPPQTPQQWQVPAPLWSPPPPLWLSMSSSPIPPPWTSQLPPQPPSPLWLSPSPSPSPPPLWLSPWAPRSPPATPGSPPSAPPPPP